MGPMSLGGLLSLASLLNHRKDKGNMADMQLARAGGACMFAAFPFIDHIY